MLDTADAIAGGNGVKGEKELGVVLVNVFLNKSGLGQTLINVSVWRYEILRSNFPIRAF